MKVNKLELIALRKCYGDLVALDDLTITFTSGVYGILGANGAGKSTMMNLIADNLKRTSGQILFDGTDILELGTDFRAKLGYMPQEQGFFEGMNIDGFLFYMANLKGVAKKQAKSELDELLPILNLESVRHKRISSLSGGMRQRVLLAQALLGDPNVVILDEPTAGLDPKERIRLRDFIAQLARERIVLLATHVVSDVESIASQILLMQRGKLVKMDTPQALLESVRPFVEQPVNGRLSLEDVYLYYLGE